MSDKTFVDSNILIYAHDADAKRKQGIAKEILRELWEGATGIVSMQVLQEFYVHVTRKIPSPLSRDAARVVVNTYAFWCIETTAAEIATAFRVEDEARLGFWDALIISSAAKGGAARILSEDLNHGQKIFGIRIENPFMRASR